MSEADFRLLPTDASVRMHHEVDMVRPCLCSSRRGGTLTLPLRAMACGRYQRLAKHVFHRVCGPDAVFMPEPPQPDDDSDDDGDAELARLEAAALEAALKESAETAARLQQSSDDANAAGSGGGDDDGEAGDTVATQGELSESG